MPTIFVPMWVSEEVFEKLKTGEYERVGGVIRRSDNKRIVCWLRQFGDLPEKLEKDADPLIRILVYSWDIEDLSDEELITLGKYINEHSVLSKVNFYQGCKGAVSAIIDKFERLYEKYGKENAIEYAKKKRQSLINIFSRTFTICLVFKRLKTTISQRFLSSADRL